MPEPQIVGELRAGAVELFAAQPQPVLACHQSGVPLVAADRLLALFGVGTADQPALGDHRDPPVTARALGPELQFFDQRIVHPQDVRQVGVGRGEGNDVIEELRHRVPGATELTGQSHGA
jgi:hypothetical protein